MKKKIAYETNKYMNLQRKTTHQTFETVAYMSFLNFDMHLFYCPSILKAFYFQNPNVYFWELFLSVNDNTFFLKTSLFFYCYSTTPSKTYFYFLHFFCFLSFIYSALNIKLIRIQFLASSYHSTNSFHALLLHKSPPLYRLLPKY